MNVINLVFFSDYDNYEKYQHMEKYLSIRRREMISRYLNSSDKLLSLMVALLVRYDLSATTGIPNNHLSFETGKYGKPYLSCFSDDVFFSVSHSNGCAAYCRSESECGIDTEFIHDIGMSIADRWFSKDEAEYIRNSSDPVSEQIKIWTQKEAYLKMKGIGLNTPLDSFSVLNEPVSDKLFTFCEQNNYISFCSDSVKLCKTNISILMPQKLCDEFEKFSL